jgi:hypothetical protein
MKFEIGQMVRYIGSDPFVGSIHHICCGPCDYAIIPPREWAIKHNCEGAFEYFAEEALEEAEPTLESLLEGSCEIANLIPIAGSASEDARKAREYRDVILSNVYNVLKAAGKKSMRVSGWEARIAAVTILHCKCHGNDVTLCSEAIKGEPVEMSRAEGERCFVSRVKR